MSSFEAGSAFYIFPMAIVLSSVSVIFLRLTAFGVSKEKKRKEKLRRQ